MASQMSQYKETANGHMRTAIESGGKWTCACEACHQIRSLVGMEKTLGVRPLVREIHDLEVRLHEMPDGADKRSLLERYLKLYDELADAMAK